MYVYFSFKYEPRSHNKDDILVSFIWWLPHPNDDCGINAILHSKICSFANTGKSKTVSLCKPITNNVLHTKYCYDF